MDEALKKRMDHILETSKGITLRGYQGTGTKELFLEYLAEKAGIKYLNNRELLENMNEINLGKIFHDFNEKHKDLSDRLRKGTHYLRESVLGDIGKYLNKYNKFPDFTRIYFADSNTFWAMADRWKFAGFDLTVEMAKKNPDKKFYVICSNRDYFFLPEDYIIVYALKNRNQDIYYFSGGKINIPDNFYLIYSANDYQNSWIESTICPHLYIPPRVELIHDPVKKKLLEFINGFFDKNTVAPELFKLGEEYFSNDLDLLTVVEHVEALTYANFCDHINTSEPDGHSTQDILIHQLREEIRKVFGV